MARKTTPGSLTSAPCRCSWLRDAASEPQVPVRFEEKFGEYQLERRDGGYLVIRQCPWCGGAAPSKRASLFATFPNTELRRLERLTARLKTVEDALAELGEPDDRQAEGVTIHTPTSGRRRAKVETFPTMTFSKLSKVADVTLVDYGRRGVGFTFSPKYLGRRTSRNTRRRSP